MALNPVTTTNISLQTTGVSRAGFGTPIFISSHRAFQNRTGLYQSLAGVAGDFETTSETYLAASAFFSNTPSGAQFKSGRREADATLTPIDVADTSVHTVTVTVNDGDLIAASFTVSGVEDAEDVCTGLKADIDGATEVAAHVTATVVGVGSAAVLEIAPILSTDRFTVTGLEKVTQSYTSVETAADAMVAIQSEDDDFYFVTTEDDDTFRTAMRAVVEPLSKLFFSAVDAVAFLDTPATVTPTLGRSVEIWHQGVSTFPELQWIGVNAPYSPDENAVTWAGNKLSLFPESIDSRTGNKLTASQQTSVLSHGQNMVTLVGGVAVTRQGKVLGGEWIDTMRGRDTMTARIDERVSSLIINQQGGKIPYTASGLAQIDAAISSALQPFVDSNFLESYTVEMPTIGSISSADKQARILNNVKFTAYLAGAIHEVVVNGTLTISEG